MHNTCVSLNAPPTFRSPSTSDPKARRPRLGGGAAALLALAAAACIGPERPPERAPDVAFEPSPAGPRSGQPQVTVAADDGRFLLSWIERADDADVLRFAARPPRGRFGEARTVTAGADLFVNWADVPSIVALPDGTLAAHWLARTGEEPHAYGVRVTLSHDGAASWSAPIVPHRDGTPSEHGFVSLLPWDGGRLGLAWLDGRETLVVGSAGAASHGQEGAGGAMRLRAATLDARGGLGDETLVDARVCDCCQTAMARAADAILLAYRDRSPDEQRDISLVRYREGRWSEPASVSRDGWKIAGCPVNGPALAADGARVALAWFTMADGVARVKLAFSQDAGESFGAPLVVDDGEPLGRVDVVLTPAGDALVSWMEQAGDAAQIRLRRLAPGGGRGPAAVVTEAAGGRGGGFPRMARSGDEVLIAWTDPQQPPQVRTATILLR
jgi:hypothetical protein